MDASLSRSSIPKKSDPHDWNSWDHYQAIHDRRLAEHPFVDYSKTHTLQFLYYEEEDVLSLTGMVYCFNDVILEVEKWFELADFGQVLKIRGFSYRYVGWVKDKHCILRYHNVHQDDDDYHHRIFDYGTGVELKYERLERWQFPTFSEVLDELGIISGFVA